MVEVALRMCSDLGRIAVATSLLTHSYIRQQPLNIDTEYRTVTFLT